MRGKIKRRVFLRQKFINDQDVFGHSAAGAYILPQPCKMTKIYKLTTITLREI